MPRARRGVGRVRHLDLRWLWLQQLVHSRRITLKKVSGKNHVADVGTKYLPPEDLVRYREMLGLAEVEGGSISVGALVALSAARVAMGRHRCMAILALGGLPVVSASTDEEGNGTMLTLLFTMSVCVIFAVAILCACRPSRGRVRMTDASTNTDASLGFDFRQLLDLELYHIEGPPGYPRRRVHLRDDCTHLVQATHQAHHLQICRTCVGTMNERMGRAVASRREQARALRRGVNSYDA